MHHQVINIPAVMRGPGYWLLKSKHIRGPLPSGSHVVFVRVNSYYDCKRLVGEYGPSMYVSGDTSGGPSEIEIGSNTVSIGPTISRQGTVSTS